MHHNIIQAAFLDHNVLVVHLRIIELYCILRGQIKGYNRSITTIMYEVGSYRTVVG